MKLSIVIPSRNRRDLLSRCLRALTKQTEDPGSFEVVVVSDGSEDGTVEMLDRLQTPFRLRTLRLDPVGRHAAREAGVQVATAPVCLLLDDDVIVEPGMVGEHVAAHASDANVIGIGRISLEVPSSRDWYARRFVATWNRHYANLEHKADWTACYGGNLSAPRDALKVAAGLVKDRPVQAGEDVELGFRLHQQGCAPRYLPRAHGVHIEQKGRKRLLADSRRKGIGSVELSEKIPETTPELLGWFNSSTRRESVLRRAMIAFRLPPAVLAALGRLLPGAGRQEIWFDFVSRYAFWLSVRRQLTRERWVQTTHDVPILMYHAFGERNESDRYVVPRRRLALQMRLLSLLRYRVVPFEDLVTAYRESRLPPARALAITIDDGYRDNLDVAHPILAKHGFAVTIFLVTGRIGGVNDWTKDGALHNRPLLSIEQIRQLRDDGVRFGAHTRTHRPLPEIASEDLPGEIAGSRDDLQQALGSAVPSFAYPHGEFDERAVEATRQAGFSGACTVVPRLARLGDDPLQLPRVEIRAADSPLRFLRKVLFGGR